MAAPDAAIYLQIQLSVILTFIATIRTIFNTKELLLKPAFTKPFIQSSHSEKHKEDEEGA